MKTVGWGERAGGRRSARLAVLVAVGGGVLAALAADLGASRTNVPAIPASLPVVAKPAPQQPAVGSPADTHLDKTPPRRTKGLDLVKSGWTYNCMECHTLFASRWHYQPGQLNEHKDVNLQHGNNRYCLNCHHPDNRNAFVDYDGAEIAQTDVVLLCAKCHGPTYRDWKAGVHGRQNGFWNAAMGEKTKLKCIQCHDPHHPVFQAMKPLPPLRYPPRAAHPPAEHVAAAAEGHQAP